MHRLMRGDDVLTESTEPIFYDETQSAWMANGSWWSDPDGAFHVGVLPDVPQAVTMRQARLALLGAGLLANVNAAIAGMPGALGDAARIEWEFSSAVERNKPLVAALTGALGMTADQIDSLFIAAAGL